VGAQSVLAHQIARKGIAAQAARAGVGVLLGQVHGNTKKIAAQAGL
jgi:hypothetical protein